RSTGNLPYVFVTNALGLDPVSLVYAKK
ncbi:hypothetical protein MNBD_GAMMA02-406, partial [hydrothermal vent metagenome]